ncbi:Auxin Efflux Carrier [Alicyclobacillus acidocaldarius subsp. acidocaldarius Tc-4-1]|uniref:Auxin Efflux Carrier n=1 Tax=Alicyclobacillus acidocaldarius (strain Tc-4-1) TaxID=1048834 RepID=F8IJ52_ALIAT|nr:Auxin Efflux Carrier [Alicyclobacillus acidocaldarius subsp. acidocaldarius Tc-4-1]
MGFLHLLWTITVPILIVCVAGALVARYQPVETKSLSTVALYLLAPALILSALPSANLRGNHVVQIALFTAVMTAFCWVAAIAAGRLFRLDRATSRALMLTTIFSNSNNYGLPVLLLAFGTQGFALGTLYVILQILLVNTLGVSIAASGRSGESGWRALLRAPLLYASALGLVLAILHQPLPGGISTAAKLLGNAYAAVVLLILGMQLGHTRWLGAWRKDVWLGRGAEGGDGACRGEAPAACAWHPWPARIRAVRGSKHASCRQHGGAGQPLRRGRGMDVHGGGHHDRVELCVFTARHRHQCVSEQPTTPRHPSRCQPEALHPRGDTHVPERSV